MAGPLGSDMRTDSGRAEGYVVLVLTLVAFLIRARSPQTLGLTHFDEGVYAGAGLWSVLPGGLAAFDPQVISYAPPGLPILIGLAYVILGVGDLAALSVTIVAGSLTVPCVAWVARRTFGPGAGAASAAFVAGSMAHVAFSRKALTDAPYLLVWVVCLGLGGRFLERPRLGRAVALGVAAGVAQNFKYNGGMLLAVVALTSVWNWAGRRDLRPTRQLLTTLWLSMVAVLTAAILYAPWYLFVENHGGYAALVRHHSRYVGGLETWWPHARVQLAQVVALSGSVAERTSTWMLAVLVGWGISGELATMVGLRGRVVGTGVALLAGLITVATLCPDAGWWLGLAAFARLLRDAEPSRRLLGMTWLVFSLVTPFYHPYARLWLPLHALGWIIQGALIVELRPDRVRSLFSEPLRLRAVLFPGVVVGLLILSRAHWGTRRPEPLSAAVLATPTDLFRTAVDTMNRTATPPTDGSAAIRILARRPLAYYLLTRSPYAVQLLADADSIENRSTSSRDWLVVDQAVLAPGVVETGGTIELGPGWIKVKSFRALLDPVTSLDVAPGACFDTAAARPYELAVFRPDTGITPFPTRLLPHVDDVTPATRAKP